MSIATRYTMESCVSCGKRICVGADDPGECGACETQRKYEPLRAAARALLDTMEWSFDECCYIPTPEAVVALQEALK